MDFRHGHMLVEGSLDVRGPSVAVSSGSPMTVESTLSASGPAVLMNSSAVVLGCKASAVADGTHFNGSVSFWVNEPSNTLNFKVKYSTGTVKSGSVNLT